jgi:hypothetical protein
MTGKLGKFYVEYGIHGGRVMTTSHSLTAGCLHNDEIDSAIQLLKDDLDACAREMKKQAIRKRDAFLLDGLSDSEKRPA